jgi:predicted RNase H-like HicB family nuclease
MATPKLVFTMKVPATVRHEGKWFFSSCRVLDVHSQGTTQQEALDNLVEALQLFIETCYEHGTLEQMLRSQGFVPGRDEESEDECLVEVPLYLTARKHAEARAY